MSVECRMFIGLTVEFARDLRSSDFRKVEAFTEKHPELDVHNYHIGDLEGKLLLVDDGMNGQFVRLVKVDKFVDGVSLGGAYAFMELPVPGQYSPELISTIEQLYLEYTGKKLDPKDMKYAMWSQWYSQGY